MCFEMHNFQPLEAYLESTVSEIFNEPQVTLSAANVKVSAFSRNTKHKRENRKFKKIYIYVL